MVQKFRAWWAAHPVVRDAILAGVAAVVGYVSAVETNAPLPVVALVYVFVRAAIGYYIASHETGRG